MRQSSLWTSTVLASLLPCLASSVAAQEGRRVDPGGLMGTPDAHVVDRLKVLGTGISLEIPQTHLETGFFSEVNDEGFQHWVVHTPGIQPFRWTTDWDEAEEGYWRLRGPGRRGADVVLASGVVPGTGTFQIDLRDHLPARPPSEPIVYKVDIVARTAGTVTDAATARPRAGGVKVPPKDLGVRSVPVLITYVADTAPPTRFEIPTVYRKADFVLDKITAIDLQTEIGTEEYRVAGFVQELFRTCHDEASLDCGYKIPGFHQQFGPFGKDLSPGRKTVAFGVPYEHPEQGWITEKNRWTFDVKSQSGHPLARRLVVTASVLEVDSGGELDDWTFAIREFEDAIYIDKILEFSESELEEFLEENAGEVLRLVADGVMSFVESAAEVGSAIPVVGQAVLAVGFVVDVIVTSMPDDYCGTTSHMVTLPTRGTIDVHELPGKVEGSGAEQRYVTDSFELRYECPPHPQAASPYPDGFGDIYFHWEFHDPYTP